MSRLTVTEKEHWKERIECRFNKAIDDLTSQQPTLLRTIEQEAEAKAHEQLGTDELQASLAKIEAKRQSLDAEEVLAKANICELVLGKELRRNNEYSLHREFESVLKKHRERLETTLLAESDIGQRILAIRAEKESLLDTIWLATSNTQVRDLWSRVSEVLGDQATPLQQQVLADSADTSINQS